jgi:hypothetical protein
MPQNCVPFLFIRCRNVKKYMLIIDRERYQSASNVYINVFLLDALIGSVNDDWTGETTSSLKWVKSYR